MTITWDNVLAKALELLMPVIATLLTVLIAYAAGWLRLQTAKIKGETAQQALKAAIDQAERVGIDAVLATNQVFVDSIKEDSADGKLTDEEKREAMDKAVKYVKDHMAPWALSVLEATFGPVERWLEGLLEAKLGQVKWGEAAYDIVVPPSSPGDE